MKKVLILFIVISLTLSGCWDQKIFEKTGFTLMESVEKSKTGDDLLITSTIPAIGAKDTYGIEMFTTSADSLMEGRENRNRMASKRTEAGKLQQILFSDEIAKKGIHNLLEIFNRLAEESSIAFVIVTEGSPLEIIQKSTDFKDIPGPALYISQLTKNAVKDLCAPNTMIYNFNIDYFAPGIDPVTPLIKLKGNHIEVEGSALFSGDRMVGKLDAQKSSLLLGMMGKHKDKEFSYTVPMPEKEKTEDKLGISMIECKRKVDVELQDGKPSANISLYYEGVIEEFKWNKLSDIKKQNEIQDYLDVSIKKDCMEIIKYLQKVGSDPIGIGEIVRAKYYGYFKNADWKDVYKSMPFNVDVKVDIKQYGIID